MQRTSWGTPLSLHFVLVDCAPVANPTNVDADFRISMMQDQFICFAMHVRGDVRATLPFIINDFEYIPQAYHPELMVQFEEYSPTLVGGLYSSGQTDPFHFCRIRGA